MKSDISISIVNARFDCKVESLTDLNGTPAIIPGIEGRAWIFGETTVLRDPNDP